MDNPLALVYDIADRDFSAAEAGYEFHETADGWAVCCRHCGKPVLGIAEGVNLFTACRMARRSHDCPDEPAPMVSPWPQPGDKGHPDWGRPARQTDPGYAHSGMKSPGAII